MWRYNGEPTEDNPYRDGKWRFGAFDFDYSVGLTYQDFGGVESYQHDSFKKMDKVKEDIPTVIFAKLLDNPEFRQRFADRFYSFAYSVFEASKMTEELDNEEARFMDYMTMTAWRWNNISKESEINTFLAEQKSYYHDEMDIMRTFFQKRAEYAVENMQNYLGISKDTATITVTSDGNGSIAVDSADVPLSGNVWTGSFESGKKVTLTAKPAEGYIFAGWSGALNSSSETITVTADKAVALVCSFKDPNAKDTDKKAKNNVERTAAVIDKWESGDCTVTIDNDGTLTVSGSGAMEDYVYSTDRPWFYMSDDIKRIVIEKGVTSVGTNAFCDQNNLAGELILPEGLKTIGRNSFANCPKLTKVSIPSTTTFIGKEAFYNCPAVTDVYLYSEADKLTWSDKGCDDFNKNGSTKCHVKLDWLEVYQSSKFSDVNVTFIGDILTTGKLYKQTAKRDSSYYTRFVFVKPKAEITGKNKAVFTATYKGNSRTFATDTCYSTVTSNGVEYTADLKDSVMLVVTVKSSSDISADITCKLDLE